MTYGVIVSFNIHVIRVRKEHGRQGSIDMCIKYTNSEYKNVYSGVISKIITNSVK